MLVWDGIMETVLENDWDVMEYMEGRLCYEDLARRLSSRDIAIDTPCDIADRLNEWLPY